MKKGLNPRRIQISGPELVKVEAAVDRLRPTLCLIRGALLNKANADSCDADCGSENAKWCLVFLPVRSPSPVRRIEMEAYKVAGIDIHKRMLAVVVTDAAEVGEFRFERRKFGVGAIELRQLEEWLAEQDVREVVMESTAQYWKPVWQSLEGNQIRLHLAQAHSNKAPKGRKRDFTDAERLVRRHIAGELILSFVPDSEQRLWRTLTRTRNQLTQDRVRLQNQLEGYLEQIRIKLSGQVSDLLGLSARRMLQALAEGESDATKIAGLAAKGLRASRQELENALSAAEALTELQRGILKMFLERLDLLDRQIDTLERAAAEALHDHQDAVCRLAEVPGLGAGSAHRIIAEVGPQAATFPSAAHMASWVGCCPGREESAEVSASDSSPKGNRHMRHILAQAANAAVKAKGSVFEILYRRLAGRRGHFKAIWAVAHRICRIAWKILHEGVKYEERGLRTNPTAVRQTANRLVRNLRRLGYEVQLTPLNPEAAV
jgi:transposase